MKVTLVRASSAQRKVTMVHFRRVKQTHKDKQSATVNEVGVVKSVIQLTVRMVTDT